MNQLAGLWSYDNVSMINILNIENLIFGFKLLPFNILAVKFMQIVFFLMFIFYTSSLVLCLEKHLQKTVIFAVDFINSDNPHDIVAMLDIFLTDVIVSPSIRLHTQAKKHTKEQSSME